MKRMTLREARQRRKLTQVQLAASSGIAQDYISKLEVGKVLNPSFDRVVQLAAALDIDPRVLLFGLSQPSQKSRGDGEAMAS